MRVAVTGAPGWLGTELVRELADRKAELRCLLLEGEDAGDLESFSLDTVRGDVRDPDSLDPLYEGDVDTVFHCAGVIHPPSPTGAKRLLFDVNAEGTRNMLEKARQHGADHFVYVSTNAAQGFSDGPEDRMTEEGACEPESIYGRSKYEAEQHVRRYGEDYGLDYTIVRPCWYYGPRQPERMATLMRMIEGGRPLVFGNGENLRSMTYVPKLVEALLQIADQPATSRGETYWITDLEPYTTNHIYETIARCLGVEDLSPMHVPAPVSWACEVADVLMGKAGLYNKQIHVAGEMRRDIAATPEKAMKQLGYEPPRSLAEGMQRSVDWAREHDQL